MICKNCGHEIIELKNSYWHFLMGDEDKTEDGEKYGYLDFCQFCPETNEKGDAECGCTNAEPEEQAKKV